MPAPENEFNLILKQPRQNTMIIAKNGHFAQNSLC